VWVVFSGKEKLVKTFQGMVSKKIMKVVGNRIRRGNLVRNLGSGGGREKTGKKRDEKGQTYGGKRLAPK